MSTTPIQQRLRITFGKYGALKYIGNLDVAKTWERVLRRAALPILYTQGFNTRPRIQLALALPLGITSECEIIDVALKSRIPLDGLADTLLAVSPAGLTIEQIEEVPTLADPLESQIRAAEYRITFVDGVDVAELQTRIDALLAHESIIKEKQRKGKRQVYDIRPLIHDLHITPPGELEARLAAGTQGNLRPDDLLAELGYDGVYVQMHRYRLHLVR